MTEIINNIITNSGFWTFIGIAISLYFKNLADKKRTKSSDVKISDIDKRQTEKINRLSKEVTGNRQLFLELKDDSKHGKFTKTLINSLIAESYTYIADFEGLNKDVKSFLLQGATGATSIFSKILNSGFENYNKQIIINQFDIAAKDVSSKFKFSNFPIEKKELISIITAERGEFIHNLDMLMKSGKTNGVRRAEFKLICKKMVMNVIKQSTKLKGSNV